MVKKQTAALLLSLILLLSGCTAATGEPLGASGDSGAAADASLSGYTHYSEIFEGDRVIDVYVTIAEEDWQSILESPLDKDYKSVTVDFGGIILENVGFSTKGNSTLRSVAGSDSDRYSFRFKFDKFTDGQTLLGLDKMSMNNNMTDASYLREYLHYEALALTGIPTPMTTFVNLYINGELYALYTAVENEEKAFLERCFGENYKQGVLYDTGEGATLLYEESGEYKAYTYDRGVEDGKASLAHFIQVLNEMPAGEKGDIESVLDVDSALIYIAANMVFGNYDSYNGQLAHNYKLYGDAQGRFTVLPWDYNMSFGGFPMGGGDTTVSIAEPVSGTALDKRPLIQNLLAVDEYYSRYLAYVELFTDYLEGIEARANELAVLIRPHVEADPTKFYTMEDFEASLTFNEDEEERQGPGGERGMRPGGDGLDGELPEGIDFAEGMQPPGEPPFGEGEGRSSGGGWRGDRPEGGERFGGGPGGVFQDEGLELPENAPEGRWPFEPGAFDGERPEGGGRGQRGPGGGPGGDGMMSASGSLVTFAQRRAENLRQQLAQ